METKGEKGKEQHRTRVREFRRGSPEGQWGYEAKCTCGWVSRTHVSRRAAEDDADGHVNQATE
jgi:hypothetical protein